MSQRERADRHQDIEASHPNSLRKSLDYTHIFGDDRYPIDASPADRHIGDVEIGAAPQPELTRQRWGNARYWGYLPHLRDPAAKWPPSTSTKRPTSVWAAAVVNTSTTRRSARGSNHDSLILGL